LLRKSEGIELMLIMIKCVDLMGICGNGCIRQKKFTRKSAIKALDHALMNNQENCFRFVDALGLKTLFATFMKVYFLVTRYLKLIRAQKRGKTVKVMMKKKMMVFNKRCQCVDLKIEHMVSMFVSLCKYLNESRLARFLSKFTENNYEKVERLLELHEKYLDLVRIADEKIERDRRDMGNGLPIKRIHIVQRNRKKM
jgi:beta-catenin-like protein 1